MAVTLPVIVGYAIVIGTNNHGAGLFGMFLVGAGQYLSCSQVLRWITYTALGTYPYNTPVSYTHLTLPTKRIV